MSHKGQYNRLYEEEKASKSIMVGDNLYFSTDTLPFSHGTFCLFIRAVVFLRMLYTDMPKLQDSFVLRLLRNHKKDHRKLRGATRA